MKLICTICVFIGLKIWEFGMYSLKGVWFVIKWSWAVPVFCVVFLWGALPGYFIFTKFVIWERLVTGSVLSLVITLVSMCIYSNKEYEIKEFFKSNWEEANKITGRHK